MSVKSLAKRFVKRIPVIGKPYRQRDELRAILDRLWSPPGHFYSPIPSLDEIRRRESTIFRARGAPLAGIRLNEHEQLRFADRLAEYYGDQPFRSERTADRRYYFENDSFHYCDAIVWHAMLRLLRPARVIEVGSGWSSGVLLDTNDLFLGGLTSCTFIEPYPERLLALLKPEDRLSTRLIQTNLQDVPLDTFDALASGDVLFIDSSHVSKVGSDVNYAVFEIFPRLAPGVYIHVHDIFDGFEYPEDWVYQGRSWNEAYLLHAFLMYNPHFEIVLWNSWLERAHRGWLAATMPLCLRAAADIRPQTSAQSIWLRKN